MSSNHSKEPAIILEKVTKSYRINRENLLKYDVKSIFKKNKKIVTPVKNFSMKVYKGDSIGLYGPNGVGKTTILKLIAGITYPDSGKVIVKGKIVPIIELFAGLHPELTGVENIHTNAAILGIPQQDFKKLTKKVIDFAELKDYAYNPIKKYSMGMKARLSVAIAIHTHPDILLIDESISVGDQAFRKKAYKALKKIAKTSTLIVVSHDRLMLKKFCRKIIDL